MYQAIATKYLGPTNHRGARVKATCDAGSVVVAWDHALSVPANHEAAARALARRLDWTGTWVGGALPDGRGYAFTSTFGTCCAVVF